MSGAPLGVERAPPVFRIAVVCVSPSWGTDERPVRYWTYGTANLTKSDDDLGNFWELCAMEAIMTCYAHVILMLCVYCERARQR
jgi:hypothetical protein